MASLTTIKGSGGKYAATLKAMGIRSTDALLKSGATRKDRKEIADATKLSEKRILGWVNRADLFRVKGVTEEDRELMEATGADTIKDLSKRVPGNLRFKITKTNISKQLVHRVPPFKVVKNEGLVQKPYPPQ